MNTNKQLLNQVIHHVANREIDQAAELFSQVLNTKASDVLRNTLDASNEIDGDES